jgi:hypothetical protein
MIIGVTVCSVEGCKSAISTHRGWCDKHYCRWKRHGDPLVAKKRHRTSTDALYNSKSCVKCNEIKPLNSFSRCGKSGDGVRGRCKTCVSEDEKTRRDPVRERERHRAYYQANPEKLNAKNRVWRHNNRDYVRERDKAYKALNFEQTKVSSRRSYLKERQSPVHRISHSITACIVQSIRKGSKARRRTVDLLGYSYDQLKTHLERQFQPGMTWDNYGRNGWEIDHIVPVSSFSYETPDDPDFRVCWGLPNLRPLWKADNRSKGAKIVSML